MCSQALANFFIDKSLSEDKSITNMKLQKLMFIGYGWVLALTEKDITDGEGFEAWMHGPVLASVYHEMKHFGDRAITSYATEYDLDDNTVIIPKITTDVTNNILNKVWEVYKEFSAGSLRNLTHEDATPWKQSYTPSVRGIAIKNDIVSQYYITYLKNLLS